jgi:hypothetical protein
MRSSRTSSRSTPPPSPAPPAEPTASCDSQPLRDSFADGMRVCSIETRVSSRMRYRPEPRTSLMARTQAGRRGTCRDGRTRNCCAPPKRREPTRIVHSPRVAWVCTYGEPRGLSPCSFREPRGLSPWSSRARCESSNHGDKPRGSPCFRGIRQGSALDTQRSLALATNSPGSR